MPGYERRIEAVEQALQPERPIVVYMEDRAGQPGQFRRQGSPGRLLTRNQVSADATAANATAVIVIYKTAGPSLDIAVPQIHLPDNGRTEEL